MFHGKQGLLCVKRNVQETVVGMITYNPYILLLENFEELVKGHKFIERAFAYFV